MCIPKIDRRFDPRAGRTSRSSSLPAKSSESTAGEVDVVFDFDFIVNEPKVSPLNLTFPSIWTQMVPSFNLHHTKYYTDFASGST
jgi:hypothetical protein